MRRILGIAATALCASAGVICAASPGAQKAATASPAQFSIGGTVSTPLTIFLDDLKKMPRTTLRVMNPHSQKMEAYEGVALATLLEKAGVPHGEQLRGAALASCLLVEAADGYRVVYSLAELDSGFQDSEVLAADTMDGAPLREGVGPVRLVAPHDKRPARWVRMVKAMTIVKLPGAK